MVRTRFAPSPTGMLHVGSLRTALFAYLYAKKHGGKFLLRIEDTDRERYVPEGIQNILQSLAWGGVLPDEGVYLNEKGEPAQKGDCGPYIQSERLPIYQRYIHELLDKGDAYYCFCTKERLEELRTMQEFNKLPPGYDGHCRNLSKEEVEKQLAETTTHVVRMKMPKEGNTVFEDMIRGTVSFQNALVDDQVILKSDGFPTYHFAVVIDDHFMEITHVIRGEEWISSTPKHIELFRMFGWEAPKYAHLSLLVNEQKKKLSKRHGDVAVLDFEKNGYLPEAIVNFVAFLGWNPGTDQEIFSLKQLEEQFDITQVGKSASVFNREKLNWYNQQYMRSLPPEQLTIRVLPFLEQLGLVANDHQWLATCVLLERERVSTLKELAEAIAFLFPELVDYEASLLVWKKSTPEDAKNKLTAVSAMLRESTDSAWTREVLEQTLLTWIKENNFGVGDVLWPIRTALSGKQNSPGPFDLLAVLGKEKSLARLAHAISLLA